MTKKLKRWQFTWHHAPWGFLSIDGLDIAALLGEWEVVE